LEAISWKSLVCVFEDSASLVEKSRNLKLRCHLECRTWSHRSGYRGHTLTSRKSTSDWTFYKFPPLFFPCMFNYSLWKYEEKNPPKHSFAFQNWCRSVNIQMWWNLTWISCDSQVKFQVSVLSVSFLNPLKCCATFIHLFNNSCSLVAYQWTQVTDSNQVLTPWRVREKESQCLIAYNRNPYWYDMSRKPSLREWSWNLRGYRSKVGV